MVKKTLSTLGDDLGPLVADLVTMTSAMYQMSPHPPVLDLSKHLVILYGGDQPAHRAALSAFVAQICSATLIAFGKLSRRDLLLTKNYQICCASRISEKSLLNVSA